jgi:hypothetical protein
MDKRRYWSKTLACQAKEASDFTKKHATKYMTDTDNR